MPRQATDLRLSFPTLNLMTQIRCQAESMAAYAALVSLAHIIEQIQNHPRPPITLDEEQTKSLCEKISFLQDFLDNYPFQCHLESQIADLAHSAEDIIESRIVDQIFLEASISHGSERSSQNFFSQDLQKVIQGMDLIKKEVVQFQEKRGMQDVMPKYSIRSSDLSAPTPTKNNTFVGFDEIFLDIISRLTEQCPDLQILPIVGMGGIGKTTLARNVYDHSSVLCYFDVRVWVTISQEFRVREILLTALFCANKGNPNENFAKFADEMSQVDLHELGLRLYRSLSGRRFLIIMDDMWSIEAWEKLKFFFPKGSDGSRIMITTRLSVVASYFGTCSVKMNFLDEDKSWELLSKTAFGKECCPLELKEIGEKIAKKCRGLPLSVVLVGGLLASSEKTQKHWEFVAENLSPILNLKDDEHCSKILSLSYDYLPVHLKPCFLYMGVFPEDSEIRVSWLVKLWIAEGFLKPIKSKSLEAVARAYLNDLIDRNLILVHTWGSSGTVKFCYIHDLLRDLCIREARKERFICVTRVHDFDIREGMCKERRISIHQSTSCEDDQLDQVLHALPSASLARSLICDIGGVLASLPFRLLRVFKVVDKYFYVKEKSNHVYSLEGIFQLVNSRYLAFKADWSSNSKFPSSVRLLWNLQTLIVKGTWGDNIVAPSEIWEISQLRHVEFDWLFLQNPSNVTPHGGDVFILRDLQTLSEIANFRFTEDIVTRIPNIKKLKVSYDDYPDGWSHYYCLNNLVSLSKLESLACIFLSEKKSNHGHILRQSLAFPLSLKKLRLHDSCLLWEDMTIIGSLPYLEVLKLQIGSFKGPEWSPVEGEFLCLKSLLIEACDDLVEWTADNTHFPRLERLVLERLEKLREIPLEIGEIPTLQYIELKYCSDSAVISAKNILDEQEALGNEGLQVRVHLLQKSEELENLARENFKVEVCTIL